ncbi:hypothetical protein EIN_093490 [Entamoeba invadens IP1]|uniref:Uncharacterized protein n=1 Tax=Entamoeba invadens IP1 TaxID=370355 RepID=A0A0A1TZX6_ENTIV|nr:hypothetical protein EIN_093490 [Entamoeba invadens IP1]ELP87192.1 hypothetical protein EIN_093490 [Entamoeba invadens IP1]|eukprot:XP_004253963.1 hypothetical protein EIN_093490 [Entamoeba invadens IP1]
MLQLSQNSVQTKDLCAKLLTELRTPITYTRLHTINYCLPSDYHIQLISYLECPDLIALPKKCDIKKIVQETLCLSRKLVKPTLTPQVDYILISDNAFDIIRTLYKTHSMSFGSLPKIGVVCQDGKISYEKDVPTYKVKVSGISVISKDYLVKISQYTSVGDLINFVTYKLRVEEQFACIQLFSNKTKVMVEPETLLCDVDSFDFTLVYTRKKRASTVAFGVSSTERCDSNIQTLLKSPRAFRVASPIQRDLWSFSQL